MQREQHVRVQRRVGDLRARQRPPLPVRALLGLVEAPAEPRGRAAAGSDGLLHGLEHGFVVVPGLEWSDFQSKRSCSVTVNQSFCDESVSSVDSMIPKV